MEVIFRGGTTGSILTIGGGAGGRVLGGDVAIDDGAIVHVGGDYTPRGRDYAILDCEGCVIMPGLVSAHTHLVQSLARGRADDLDRADVEARVLAPYHARLDEAGATAAAELACAELLLGGTTAVLDTAAVHVDAVASAAARSGLRATVGLAVRDTTDLERAADAYKRWHGASGGRLRYGYALGAAAERPDDVLAEVARRGQVDGVRVHAVASETAALAAAARQRFGVELIEHLAAIGLAGDHVALAHPNHLTDRERRLLAESRTHVVHCPTSSLKLAAGVARVPELITAGVSVALGGDGAATGGLDGFAELRLAALLHRPGRGPRAMPASEAVRLATAGGAAAMGLADRIGALDIARRGDVIAVAVDALHAAPATQPYAAIAFAARPGDVRHVTVDGQIVVRDRRLLTLDADRVRARAKAAARAVFTS